MTSLALKTNRRPSELFARLLHVEFGELEALILDGLCVGMLASQTGEHAPRDLSADIKQEWVRKDREYKMKMQQKARAKPKPKKMIS